MTPMTKALGRARRRRGEHGEETGSKSDMRQIMTHLLDGRFHSLADSETAVTRSQPGAWRSRGGALAAEERRGAG